MKLAPYIFSIGREEPFAQGSLEDFFTFLHVAKSDRDVSRKPSPKAEGQEGVIYITPTSCLA